MTDRNKVELIVFDDGDGIQIDFKFDDAFCYDSPSPVEEVAMAIFMYASETLQGEIVESEV